MTEPLLRLENLGLRYGNGVQAVDGISLSVMPRETLAIVGESGCGKSSLGKLIMRLHEPTSGRILFDGQDITALSRKQLRPLRRHFQMIFQDPFASLNPRSSVGSILETQLVVQGIGDRRLRAQDVAKRVGLDPTALDRYPHEFSGGQRQRIGIARALILEPKLLICDEPVSALDVSIRAQILNLLLDLQAERGLTYVFISHDMGVVEHIADRVAVMYLGRMVEVADAADLFRQPRHPYTQALLAAVPRLDPDSRHQITPPIAGDLPSPINPPDGCHYHPRCPLATDICRKARPPLVTTETGGTVACHHADLTVARPAGAMRTSS